MRDDMMKGHAPAQNGGNLARDIQAPKDFSAIVRLLARAEASLSGGKELRNPEAAASSLLAASLQHRVSADLKTGCGDILVRLNPIFGAVSAALRLYDADSEVREKAVNTLGQAYPTIAEARLARIVKEDTSFSAAFGALMLMKGRHFESADRAGELLARRGDLGDRQRASIAAVLKETYPHISEAEGRARGAIYLSPAEAKIVSNAEHIFTLPDPRQQHAHLEKFAKTQGPLARGLSFALGFEGQ